MTELSSDLILIVEDDVDIAEAIATLVQEIGPKCIIAKDGLCAFQKIQQYHTLISLVLCDIKLPHMNGLELIKKTFDEYKNIPFVIMTATSTFKLEEKYIKLGVFDYLPKPFDIEFLIGKIPEWITTGKKIKLLA